MRDSHDRFIHTPDRDHAVAPRSGVWRLMARLRCDWFGGEPD